MGFNDQKDVEGGLEARLKIPSDHAQIIQLSASIAIQVQFESLPIGRGVPEWSFLRMGRNGLGYGYPNHYEVCLDHARPISIKTRIEFKKYQDNDHRTIMIITSSLMQYFTTPHAAVLSTLHRNLPDGVFSSIGQQGCDSGLDLVVEHALGTSI
jgi:hypothetical protein